MSSKWVSYSPHILSKNSTTKTYIIMLCLLCPVLGAAVVSTGFNVLLTIGVSVASAFIADLIFKLIVEKRYEPTDVSAIFIGFVIGMCMPTGAPFYVPVIGTIFSITFIRNIAGGVGKNFVSEIAVAVVLSYMIFPKDFWLFNNVDELVPIGLLDSTIAGKVGSLELSDLLFGGFFGTIAEKATFWLLISGLVLMVLGIIDYKVPVSMLLSVFLFGWMFFDLNTAIYLMFAGGVVLAALFIATDYAVIPKDAELRFVYGILVGLVTVLIWKFGQYRIAVYYAIIIVGLLSSMFNGFKRRFNKEGERK